MPTNQNAYNSRVTDEALEKRFRDTFRSQGGAELVDDLYASGVIVPVVDFTAAATGQPIAQNLQTAWDFSTGSNEVNNATTAIISNAGFWLVDATISQDNNALNTATFTISDGLSSKTIYKARVDTTGGTITYPEASFVVFLRSGDTLNCSSNGTELFINVWYRQIATLSGDLVNPTGFTSS